MATLFDMFRDKVPSGASRSFGSPFDLSDEEMETLVSGMVPGGSGVLGAVKQSPRILNAAFSKGGRPEVADVVKWIKNEVPSWEDLISKAKETYRAVGDDSLMRMVERIGSREALADLQGGADAIARKAEHIKLGTMLRDGVIEAPLYSKGLDDPVLKLSRARLEALEQIANDIEMKRLLNASKWKSMPESEAAFYSKAAPSRGLETVSDVTGMGGRTQPKPRP